MFVSDNCPCHAMRFVHHAYVYAQYHAAYGMRLARVFVLRLKATWRLATIVKPLAAPRLIVLVWSCKGLDSRLQDRHRVSHRESEALCLRRCVCPGAASHVFDASIAQCSIARGDTAWNSPSRECAPSWHASLQRSPSKLQQIVAVCPDNAMSKVNVAAPQQGLSA